MLHCNRFGIVICFSSSNEEEYMEIDRKEMQIPLDNEKRFHNLLNAIIKNEPKDRPTSSQVSSDNCTEKQTQKNKTGDAS